MNQFFKHTLIFVMGFRYTNTYARENEIVHMIMYVTKTRCTTRHVEDVLLSLLYTCQRFIVRSSDIHGITTRFRKWELNVRRWQFLLFLLQEITACTKKYML